MELWIKELRLSDKSFFERIAARITEGSGYEISLLSCISDGIANDVLNIELDAFPIDFSGVHVYQPHGFCLYRSPIGNIPNFLDAHISVVENDSGIRDKWKLIDATMSSPAYSDLMSTIGGYLSEPWTGVINIAKPVFKIATSILAGNQDDLWLQNSGSFKRQLGHFDGEFSIKNKKIEMFFEFA